MYAIYDIPESKMYLLYLYVDHSATRLNECLPLIRINIVILHFASIGSLAKRCFSIWFYFHFLSASYRVIEFIMPTSSFSQIWIWWNMICCRCCISIFLFFFFFFSNSFFTWLHNLHFIFYEFFSLDVETTSYSFQYRCNNIEACLRCYFMPVINTFHLNLFSSDS